ncbi:MAG: hypothetical protein ABI230_08890 [Aestuariivirga sp.]
MNAKLPTIQFNEPNVVDFFSSSDLLDHDALRPLSHIKFSWELTSGDSDIYRPEDDSFAVDLNMLISQIAGASPPANYHYYENSAARLYAYLNSDRYALIKGFWCDAPSGIRLSSEEVCGMLEQATAGQDDVPSLVLAAAGRVNAALRFGQTHYDEMEVGHRLMLAGLITIILFRRVDFSKL